MLKETKDALGLLQKIEETIRKNSPCAFDFLYSQFDLQLTHEEVLLF